MARNPKTRRKAKPPSRKPRAKGDFIDALIAASAQALALPINPDWQPAVRFNLQLLLSHASLIDEFALPDDIEPGPVFHA